MMEQHGERITFSKGYYYQGTKDKLALAKRASERGGERSSST